jgi:UDP-N-acetylglucosamine acyltransferase
MSEPKIHPSAVVEPGASIDPTAWVGPFAVIGPDVLVGPETRVEAHAVIQGRTVIGTGNWVGPHAVLGAPPQVRDLEDHGELKIGRHNWFREFCTVHSGWKGATRIGDHNLLMAYSHVAHDCQLGDGVELANGVQLAGHVLVESHVAIGGLAAVHQFVRIGAFAFIGAGSMVSQDVPPFTLACGDRARSYGPNVVGLRRHGFDSEHRRQIKQALKLLHGAATLSEGLERIRDQLRSRTTCTQQLVAFCEASRRGICPPARRYKDREGRRIT